MPTDTMEHIYEALTAIGVFGGFVLAGVLAGFLMRRAARKLRVRLRSTPVPELFQTLAGTVSFLLFVEGMLLGLASLQYVADWRMEIHSAARVVAIILVTAGLVRGGKAALAWSAAHRKPDGKPYLDEAMVPLLRLSFTVIVYAAGVLVLLDQLQVSITPLIAGLGIGGLAVALALQPTLANYFAGTQIASDRLVKSGDYIELDNGVRGYVVEVGWRSTRVRTPFNNLIAVPNSRLADSIVTNYHGPTMDVAVIISGGVSFSSDLELVEHVAMQAAHDVIHELPEAVPTTEPWFGFDTIGESNVGFWVWVYARDRLGSFKLTSELIKRLFSRFREEGIQVNYPMRKVVPWEVNALERAALPSHSNGTRTSEPLLLD